MKSDVFISTGFGIGHLPAPGTAASAFVTIIFILSGFLGPLWLFAISVIAIAGANIAYLPAVKIWGADPSKFVLDEFFGQALALIPAAWVGAEFPEYRIWWAIAVFAIFRAFDILKPLGIKAVEKLDGLKGVMGDDILAATYTIIIQVLVIFTVLK